jgi:succinoglycan biosynthesis protein ExoA
MAPKVTLVVAMRNEEASIRACLESIERQQYAAGDLEVFVVDGDSSDRSREVARAIVSRHSTWSLLHNPRRIQAVAWNMGIERASGDVVGIVSGHAELAEDYVGVAVETLRRTGAAMVGGPVTALAEGPVAVAIGAAISSRFGVGGARHHYVTTESETDTVFMALAPGQIYRAFRFDEQMVRNQDDELSYRVIDAGHTIICNPAIRSRYLVRSSIGSLARQYWAYGFWKVRVLAKHPRRAKPRHLLPSLAVGGFAVMSPLAIRSTRARLLLASVLVPYAVVDGVLAIRHGRRQGARSGVALAIAFPTMHASYGTGFAAGLWDALRKRLP